ncbi:BT_3928 family protein [Flavobacterium sp. TSSA_36]|uniref:BT_3928 family protein n=1 Tax=Flavobacterium sp. TSSA_36 TaxID=3447669 RepID=UPI003F305A2D
MRQLLTHFSRLFVGTLFIISGLIKLNDPLGFSYKLVEYFSEAVFNVPFLAPFALAIALFLVVLEVVLGVMLLLGFQVKVTIWSLLGLIVVFTFLTFYSAYFDVVKDCGCFGDALKLKPWETFAKDIVLLVFILILYFNQNGIRPLFGVGVQKSIVLLSFVLCCFMGYWVLHHLPLKDFRPFKVGANILEGMEIPNNAPKSVVEMVFIYNVNGVKKEFTEKNLMQIPAGAVFVDRIDKVITEGYVPPIHDFTMEKDGEDFKDRFLSESKLLLVVAYDLESADVAGMKKLAALHQKALTKGYTVIGLTASSPEQIAAAKQQFGLGFDFYFCDGIALKTVERANPSIVLVSKAVVLQKVHYNDIEDLNL